MRRSLEGYATRRLRHNDNLTAGLGLEHASEGVAWRRDGDAADRGVEQVVEAAAVARDEQVNSGGNRPGQDRGVTGREVLSYGRVIRW